MLTMLIATLLLIPPSATNHEIQQLAKTISSHSEANYTQVYKELVESPPPSVEAVKRAVSQLDSEYRKNASNPNVGFDCSGLVKYAWKSDPDLPRSSRDQILYATPTEDLRPGDILWYPGHIMLYVGDNVVIHAANAQRDIEFRQVPDKPIKVGRVGDDDNTTKTLVLRRKSASTNGW